MSTDLNDFERLVAALSPWLKELVIVGGWAHRLHQRHPFAATLPYEPLRTRDADVAFGRRAKLKGSIGDALTAAGFRAELSSEEQPPIAQYFLGDDDQGFFAEFLTPLAGSGYRRDGRSDATLARAGITAQKLRHLEVLLVSPWKLPVGDSQRPPLTEPTDVLVANPVSFVVQKLLIHGDRTPSKRAQDVLYIHDTLQLFGAQWDELTALWRTEVLPSLTPTQRERVLEARRQLFTELTDTIRTAARIPQDRVLRPADVRIACEAGLAAVLAEP